MPVENLEFYWNKDSLSLIAVSLGTLSWPLITAELDEITETNIVFDSQIAKPRFTENDVSAPNFFVENRLRQNSFSRKNFRRK